MDDALLDEFNSLDVFKRDFAVNKTRTKLTEEEKKARKEWNEKRQEFADKYLLEYQQGLLLLFDQWLTSYILPPLLADGDLASSRSKYTEPNKKRNYPLEIDSWTEFSSFIVNKRVESYSPTPPLSNPLGRSILYSGKLRNETQEQSFLEQCVWEQLIAAGLMHGRSEVESISGLQVSRRSAVIGLPDNAAYAGGDVATAGRKTIVMECKSSHNLLIPNEIHELKQRYENAVKHQMQSQSKDRSSDWSHICHPFGQLLAYMLDNNVRFGALCSASKTFFVYFDGNGNDVETVRITEAYLTVQRGFFKAWASFAQEARDSRYVAEERQLRLPASGWLEETPLREDIEDVSQKEIHGSSGSGPDRKRPGGSSGAAESRHTKQLRAGTEFTCTNTNSLSKQSTQQANDNETKSNDHDAPALTDSPTESTESTLCFRVKQYDFEEDFVDFEEDFVDFYKPDAFKIGAILGTGRNGDVFESQFVTMGGCTEVVAVKQFDLSKNFDSYQKEVEAYKFLRNAWGELVPKPKFISASRSGMVRFLGLQKGTVPDGDYDQEFPLALGRLRREYNFIHLDSSHGCNAIYVEGDGNTKKLLIVDLEYWEKVRRP